MSVGSSRIAEQSGATPGDNQITDESKAAFILEKTFELLPAVDASVQGKAVKDKLEQVLALLVVPAAALQEYLSRPVVFVKTGATTFVLRLVETGARTATEVEIIRGLAAKESVVTAGSFLIKSELLKSSLGD